MAKTIGQLTQTTTLASGDEFVIEQSGLTKRVAASVVRGGLVNADIDAAAAIAFSKLAALDSANILVGNGSNVATKVAVTGDVTISNAGVTAIGSAKVTPTMLTQPLTLATAQATTSGTSFDFTGIPSWVRRITVMFGGVSTDGTSNIAIRLGTSGGFVGSGYLGVGSNLAASPSFANNDTGFRVSAVNSAASVWHGNAVLTNVTNNVWTISGALGRSDAEAIGLFAGSVDAGGQVDRVRVTTLAGNTFDAGNVNIMYEG